MLSDFIKMDFEEKSLAEFAENDLKELLDSDYYVEALRNASDLDFSYILENSNILGGSGVVLNDRLIAEASLGLVPLPGISSGVGTTLQPLRKEDLPIKNEHSYSLSREPPKATDLSDLENECFPAIPITEAEGSRSNNFCRNPTLNYTVENSSQITDPAFLKEEEDHSSPAIDSEPPSLIRHPSSETLSCCGDCCRPDEDLQLEDSISFDFEEFSSDSNKIIKEEISTSPSTTFSSPSTSTTFSAENSRNDCDSTSRNDLPANSTLDSATSVKYITLKNKPNVELNENCPTILSTRTYHQHLPSTSSSNTVVVTRTPECHKPSSILTSTLTKPPAEKNIPPNSTGYSRQSSHSSHSNERSFTYPPTPPSCSSSDSEGGSGDQSPLYEALSSHICSPRKISGHRSTSRTPINTPLISSQPRGATGTIHLTDEEKRTLISEGYPIPSRLPLSKTEEKSLKKIRRKIKNKISAQESRRKKKEYMDTLEHKVDLLMQENNESRIKMNNLQAKNSYLLQELQRLQNLVSKDEKNRSRSAVKAIISSC